MSRDNSYIRRNTADGQRDIATHTDISKELQNLSCMSFDGSLYGVAGAISELNIYSFELVIKMGSVQADARLFGVYAGGTQCWYIQEQAGFTNTIRMREGSSTFDYVIPKLGSTEPFELKIKRYGGNTYVYEDDVLIDSNTSNNFTFPSDPSMYVGAIGYSGTIFPAGTKTFYKCDFYELDSSGNRTAHLISLKGSETAGNVWLNTAEDAPADSDAIVNLNGASDGDQFTTSIYASDHNLRYGRRQVGGFDGNLFFRSLADVFTEDITYCELDVYLLTGSLASNQTLFNYGFAANTSYLGFEFLITTAGALKTNTELSGSGYIQNTITTGLVSDKFYHINIRIYDRAEYPSTTWDYVYNINDGEDSGVKQGEIAPTVINSGQTRYSHVGCRLDSVNTFNGIMYAVKFYKLDSSGNRLLSLIDWDFSNLENGVVPNTATNAPANTDAILNLNGSYSGRERVLIPQKTGLVDAYGQPIDNKEQVTRFKRLING